MVKHLSVRPEIAVFWDAFAEIGEIESVPSELPVAGGFDYVVSPRTTDQPTHSIGGYDTYDDETNEVSSLVLISDEIPRHVRGLMVAHIVMHKMLPDDGTPHLCNRLDQSVQAVLSEAEPSLIGPFYKEMKIMYDQGLSWYRQQDPNAHQLIFDRYKSALGNSDRRGELAVKSTDIRVRLEEHGLVLADGDTAINGVDKRNGERTKIVLSNEPTAKHRCKNCSHPIPRDSHRITTSTAKPVNGYDHHHYHAGCFTHVELGFFGDLHQEHSGE